LLDGRIRSAAGADKQGLLNTRGRLAAIRRHLAPSQRRRTINGTLAGGYRKVYAEYGRGAAAPGKGGISVEPIVAKITEQFKVVHDDLRKEVRGMDTDSLNWKPAPETNSIAVLVVHTLGSEAEVYRIVANVPNDRDRDAEFRVAENEADLLAKLDEADALIDDLAAGISAESLEAVRARGERAPQTGLHWLLTNYGHAREHLAHIQLTKQLLAAQS
jgi:hypothetical protein